MKNLIVYILALTLLLLSCVHHKDLTEEEREEYRKSRDFYYRMQGGGPSEFIP